MATVGQAHVPALLAAFDLGSWGVLSDGPVAAGQLGAIWRLDTDYGSWAVKQVTNVSPAELTEILEGAVFQEAARAAGVPTPGVRRTPKDELIADVGDANVRVHEWLDLDAPDTGLDPVELGRILAGLHRIPFNGSIGEDPWYTDPVGAERWAEITTALRDRGAPFADEVAAIVPDVVALERLVGTPPKALRTCHRDLWADNVRRTADGGLCVFDFDNAGLTDPSQELALVLVEYATADPSRASTIHVAYAEAGGPGRVDGPADFALPIAQLGHIFEAACRGWLAATTDDDRADKEAWAREYLDRPLTMGVIEALVSR